MVTLARVTDNRHSLQFMVSLKDNLGNPIKLSDQFGNAKQDIPIMIMATPIQNLNIESKQLKQIQQTKGGFVEIHWGEELDTISCEGTTCAFLHDQYGLTSQYREETQAYQEFLTLLQLYKNNGVVYDKYTGATLSAGSVSLVYDVGLYTGHFEEFSYTEDDTKPFQFTLNFTFKVQKSTITIEPNAALSDVDRSITTPLPTFTDKKSLDKYYDVQRKLIGDLMARDFIQEKKNQIPYKAQLDKSKRQALTGDSGMKMSTATTTLGDKTTNNAKIDTNATKTKDTEIFKKVTFK